EACSERHPIRQILARLDAREQGQPDLVQGDPCQARGTPDRGSRREAARHDALDQEGRAGRQVEELTTVIPGARSATRNPEVVDRDSPMRNCASEVRDLRRTPE